MVRSRFSRSRRRPPRRRRTPRTRYTRARRVVRRRYRRRLGARGGVARYRCVRLRYVQVLDLNPSIASVAEHIFRAASPYDPDRTGTGGQPVGYDLLANQYYHYCVIGSRIRCQFQNNGTSNQIPGYAGIILTPAADALPDTIQILQQPDMSLRGRMLPAFSSGTQNIIYHSFSAKKFFGPRFSPTNPDFGAAVNAVPNEEAYFRVFYGNIGGNDPGNVTVLVTIDYICLFTERRILPSDI